jgi:hypothetical protein
MVLLIKQVVEILESVCSIRSGESFEKWAFDKNKNFQSRFSPKKWLSLRAGC